MTYRGEPPPVRPSRPLGPSRPDPRPWLLLFAAALAARALYAVVATGPGAAPSSDAAEYDAVAWNLARGVGFALDAPAGSYPTAFVPPVVPFLVSLLYRVVGHDYFAAVLLQCVVGATVPLLLAAFGAAVFGIGIGRTAGWLAAVHPLLVFFSGYLLTETTFTAMLLLALLATVQWMKTPRAGRALGVGVLWGLAALTRPTALALPLVVVAWAWVPLGLSVAPAARRRHVLLLVLGVALAVAPWTARNAIALGAFVPVTTGGGRALLDSNNPINWSDPARRGGASSVVRLEPYRSEFAGRSEPEIDARARARALEFLASRWREWPAMAGAKLARFWRLTAEGGGTGAWQRDGSPLTALLRALDPLLVWSLAALPLALAGAWRILRGTRRWFQSLPLLVVGYFTALAVVFWGSLRMRVPIEPLVVLFAAIGIEELRRWLRARARGLRVVEGRGEAA